MSSRMDRYHEKTQARPRTSRADTNSRLYNNLDKNSNYRDISNLDDEKIVINNRKSNQSREKYHAEVSLDEILTTPKKVTSQNLAELFQKEEVSEKSNINEILKEAKENRRNFDEKEAKRKLKNEKYNILTSLSKEEISELAKKKTSSVEAKDELKELIDTLAEINIRQRIAEKTSELELLNDLLPDSHDETRITAKPDIEITKTQPVILDRSFYTKSMDLSDKDFLDDSLKISKPTTAKNFFKVLLIILLIIGIIAVAYFYYQKFF